MQQSLLPMAFDIVNELKETQVARELFLRDSTMGSQPRTQQRPKSFHGVHMNFVKAHLKLILKNEQLRLVFAPQRLFWSYDTFPQDIK